MLIKDLMDATVTSTDPSESFFTPAAACAVVTDALVAPSAVKSEPHKKFRLVISIRPVCPICAPKGRIFLHSQEILP